MLESPEPFIHLKRHRSTDFSFPELATLYFYDNQISDISPLVQNEGLDDRDAVQLQGYPLSSASINIYIPELEARGVTVFY